MANCGAQILQILQKERGRALGTLYAKTVAIKNNVLPDVKSLCCQKSSFMEGKGKTSQGSACAMLRAGARSLNIDADIEIRRFSQMQGLGRKLRFPRFLLGWIP